MPDFLDTEKAERESLRWVILRTLYQARPHGCSEQIIQRVAQDIYLATTTDVIRREMDYLKGYNLIEVHESEEQPTWQGKLTHYGVNVVEYREKAPVGVGRPPRF